MLLTKPTVNVRKMKGNKKAEPPLEPTKYGNFQMAPKPTAAPAEANTKPRRELQVERVSLIIVTFLKTNAL